MGDLNLPDNKQKDNILQTANKVNAGETIVQTVLLISMLQLVFGQIVSIAGRSFTLINVFQIILWSFIFYKLYHGKSWAKWWYIIGTAITTLVSLVLVVLLLQTRVKISGEQIFTVCHFMINTVIAIVCCCILLISKNVHEFFEWQNTD